MTWEIGIIQKMKDNIFVVDRKNKFEQILQVIPAKATAIASPGHLNSLVFAC